MSSEGTPPFGATLYTLSKAKNMPPSLKPQLIFIPSPAMRYESSRRSYEYQIP